MDNGMMENFFDRLKVEMYDSEKLESLGGFIEKFEAYIHYNSERTYLKLKRNEPGAIPNSFTRNSIFNFV